MTDDTDPIRAQYRDLPTELLQTMLLEQSDTLTEAGRTALEAELTARGVNLERERERHHQQTEQTAAALVEVARRQEARIDAINEAGRALDTCLACQSAKPRSEQPVDASFALDSFVLRVPLCASCAPRWRVRKIPVVVSLLLFLVGLALGVLGIILAVHLGLTPENDFLRLGLFAVYLALVLSPVALVHRFATWRANRTARLHPSYASLTGQGYEFSPIARGQ